MRKYALLLSMTLGTLAFNAVKAQTRSPQVEAYIQQYQALAVSEMMRTGVPASITLAQGILESGCGQSTLAKNSNNHFGIKCKTEWTGAKTYHDDDKKAECFRVYNSVEDSYRDHSDFLKNRPFYTDLFELNPTDYKAWAYGLKKDGYATERDYPQNLIKLIETYNLEGYTDLAIAKLKNGEQPYQDQNSRTALNNNTQPAQFGRPATPGGNQQPSSNNNCAADNSDGLAAINSNTGNTSRQTANRSSAPVMRIAQTLVQGPSYPVAPFSINHTKVIYAPKGMSLMALASKNNINFHKLLTLNDLGPTAVVSPGQLIYLGKRPKKGEKDFVMSKYGQTLKEIAAEQGVALKSLVNYNKVAAETPLAAAQKIYLREKTESAPETLSR